MEIIVTILVMIGVFFIMPFISFGLGWLSGWIIQITIGSSIVNGLALIGVNLPLDRLPLFFGTLAIIANFFKTTLKTTFNTNTLSKSF